MFTLDELAQMYRLRVRSPTDAQAVRVVTDSLNDRLPLITWLTDGTLSDVLGELGEL